MKLVKNNQFGRSLLSNCCSDAKIFLSDVYKKGTQAKKYQADGQQCGRSMVEMLGVLAIIGVLSIGGIAGYSKAMEKYKINKSIEHTSHILMEIVKFWSLLPDTSNNEEILNTRQATKLGIIDKSLCVGLDDPLGRNPVCEIPIGEITIHNELLAIDLEKSSNRVDTCVSFASHQWEKNFPVRYKLHEQASEESSFKIIAYDGVSYPLKPDINYTLNDIRDFCVKACDNPYRCHLYMYPW